MHWPIDRRLLKLVALIGLCLFKTPEIFAQNNCDPESSLTLATDEFNAGHFNAIEGLLTPCIENSRFTNEQLVRAYQLLIQTYLILDKPDQAELGYLNLLKANPKYISNPDRDPIDVVYLSKKFTATPIFSWDIHAGGNMTVPRVIKKNTVNDGTYSSYLIRPRGQLGGNFIWNYNDQLTAELGLDFTTNAFTYFEDNIFLYDNLTVTENQLSVQVPLSIKYTSTKRQGFNPYGYAGVSISALLRATHSYQFVNRTPVYSGNEILSFSNEPLSSDANVTFRRDFINRAFHIGGGLRWRYGLDYLFVDLRYSFGLNNVVRNDKLVRDPSVDESDIGAFAFGYVDDFFRLDQAVVSIGFIHPLYKPRKLKTARTKSVLKEVKKG